MEFRQLYEDHKDMVYNLALQYVQNREEAEEIAQDVFVKIYQSMDAFQGGAKVSSWIYRITINQSLDYIKGRKRKKRFAFLTSLFGEEGAELRYDRPAFDHPGIELEQKEAMERIFRYINALPDKQKTALILSKIEQKSQAEIAEIMQLSPKAVESLVQRAKTNLSEKLKKSEGYHS